MAISIYRRSRLTILARKEIAETDLFKRRRPLLVAFIKRSFAVSPASVVLEFLFYMHGAQL